MPFIAICVFLYFMYSMIPLNVVTGYLMSAVFVFLLMVWIGISVAQKEEETLEQILFLRIQNNLKYYISKQLFLVCIAFLIVFICTFFPFVQNQIHDGNVFVRPLTGDDLINAFLILSGCALCGGAVGNFFHPRVLKDRKMAIILATLLSVVSICRYNIASSVSIMKYICFIFPPVMLPANTYGNEDFFDLKKTIIIFLILCVYALLYSMVKNYICNKRKF